MAERPWWRRVATVRARTTLAATLLVGIAVLAGAISLVVVLRRSLVEHVDDVAEVRADDVAALAAQDELPQTLAVAGDDGGLVQVVDADGRVIAASAGLSRETPVATFRPDGPEPVIRTIEHLEIGDADTFRILARPVRTASGDVTIYVVASLEPADEAIAQLRRVLALGVPVLLVLVGVTAWFVVGRALRPVDAIREEVADISERSLDRRVPVPATDDEVSRLAATMNTMLDRLEAAADRQRRFVADASHELQTPLSSNRTELEVALSHPSSTDWQQAARALLVTNARMERLVRDLLYLARGDDPAPLPAPRPVDLDDVVLAEATRLRLEARVAVDTQRVSAGAVIGRRDDLERVVRNLLDNAARHASSTVAVEVASADGSVTLLVDDDGPGVAPADRERIFERFTRLDTARDRSRGGTGLGLAIVREIVQAHDGTVAVEAAPSGGARFVVRLPGA